jgi:molecular chaperone DnaK
MDGRPLFVGIDLGTTNSTAAAFDGSEVVVVRNGQGSVLTPSVVRIDARGNTVVGARARRFLDSDPANTRTEFKRLMGTGHELEFPASGTKRSPQQLAAEVLRGLRKDVADQFGVTPEHAVVSVPALFELPQTSATSEAARLSGFERIELIQEPVASAIAAGWSRDETSGAWLVYDLGGGTFDVSLLETREGLLRVVGHDGDNFLGGRDFDAALVDWVIGELATMGVVVERGNPAHAVALRRLRYAAEEAKIELTRASETAIVVSGLELDQQRTDVDVVVTRAQLDALVAPLIDRTIAICRRLLVSRGLESGGLERVLLVGGPTVTPGLRSRIQEGLGTPIGEGLDPMTLVAQGAALFAGTVGLDARPASKAAPTTGPKVWLQYPRMTSDFSPYVVGKLLEKPSPIAAVRIDRADGSWQSSDEPVDADGTFAIAVSLLSRQSCTFQITGTKSDGTRVPLAPPTFSITHGLTIGEPPLSRSVGVALADDRVSVFFERGSPLPIRRTFTLRTAETVSPGALGYALKVPIVQGEFLQAHLCRLVGTLEIASTALKTAVPVGTDVEVTLELDRGGRLQASARLLGVDQLFNEVALLVTPALSVEAMSGALEQLRQRTRDLQRSAFRHHSTKGAVRLAEAETALTEVERAITSACGGDLDSGERARRRLSEIDAMLAEEEAEQAWPDLSAEIEGCYAAAVSWAAQFATEPERVILAKAYAECKRAISAKDAGEVNRQLPIIRRLGEASYLRHPDAWEWEFGYASARASESSDIRRATQLVERGQDASRRGDRAALERVVRDLWALDPVDRKEQALSHGSGLRSR